MSGSFIVKGESGWRASVLALFRPNMPAPRLERVRSAQRDWLTPLAVVQKIMSKQLLNICFLN